MYHKATFASTRFYHLLEQYKIYIKHIVTLQSYNNVCKIFNTLFRKEMPYFVESMCY